MTRLRIYENAEIAKKANIKKALDRLLKLYKEDPEFRQKSIDKAKRIYQEKKQEISNMKAQLQAYQNQSIIID